MKAPTFFAQRLRAVGPTRWRTTRLNQWILRVLTPADPPESPHQAADTPAREAGSTVADPNPEVPGPEDPPTNGELDQPRSIANAGIDVEHARADIPTRHNDGAEALQLRAVSGRLDRLVSQLDLIESAVDRVAERQFARETRERRHAHRVSGLLDRLAEAQESQAESLMTLSRRMDRLERRAPRSERTSLPSLGFERDLPSVGFVGAEGRAETLLPPSATQRVRRGPDGSRTPADPSSPFGGTLVDISLPTLLSMAELEHWTGRLTVEAKDRIVAIDLEDGHLVAVFEDDSPSDAVQALYDLVEAREGRYCFSPLASVAKTELAPMTVGTLMLRVSHRQDELSRAEVGS